MVAAAVLVHHPDVAVARLAAARAALVGDLRSIRRPGGKLVIAARRDRVHVRPVVVHDHQPVVGVVGDDDLAGRRPADRSLVLEFAGGDDVIPGSVDVDDPDLVQGIPVCSLQIGDPRSIRRPGRRGDVAIGAAGQLALAAAIGVHDPDVPGALPVDPREGDLAGVGRPLRPLVVLARGDRRRAGTVGVDGDDVVVGCPAEP